MRKEYPTASSPNPLIPLLLSVPEKIMTLLPRDFITTGTPSGVGPMKPGDTIEVSIEGVGRLISPVL